MRRPERSRDLDRPSHAMRLALGFVGLGLAVASQGMAPGRATVALVGLTSIALGMVLGAALIHWEVDA